MIGILFMTFSFITNFTYKSHDRNQNLSFSLREEKLMCSLDYIYWYIPITLSLHLTIGVLFYANPWVNNGKKLFSWYTKSEKKNSNKWFLPKSSRSAKKSSLLQITTNENRYDWALAKLVHSHVLRRDTVLFRLLADLPDIGMVFVASFFVSFTWPL